MLSGGLGHHIVWYMNVNVLGLSSQAIGSRMSRMKQQYSPIRLHGPVPWNTNFES